MTISYACVFITSTKYANEINFELFHKNCRILENKNDSY